MLNVVTPMTFTLNCSNFNISAITAFGLSSNYNSSTYNIEECQNWQTSMNITTDYSCSFQDTFNSEAATACIGQTSCSYTPSLTTWLNITTMCSSLAKYDYFYLSYSCYDQWIDVLQYKISRTDFAYGVAFIDVASMLVLLIALIVMVFAQRRLEKYFKENVIEISDYTLHFKDLNFNQTAIKQELNSFLSHLYNVNLVENPEDKDEDIIYDIVYPVVTDKKLDLIIDKNKLMEKIKIKKTDLEVNQKDYTSEKIEKIRTEIAKLREEEEKIRHDIVQSNKTEMKIVNDVYVTFTKQETRDRINAGYKKGCCTRCCLICCCQRHRIQHLYYKDNWLRIQESTDEPSNIRWENVPYSTCKRCIRKTFSIIIAIIIMLASFGIVIGEKYAQEDINSHFDPNVNCEYVNPTEASVLLEFTDTSISANSRVNTFCFCRSKLISSGLTATENYTISNIYVCKDWLTMYLYSESLTAATFILVPTVNVILTVLLNILTEFERNKSVSVYVSSSMWKSFLLQLINTAIVILIVNINISEVKNWDSSFPLFTGLYSDFNPAWFQNVGVTIIFVMILNILTPHSYPLLLYMWTGCRRCCDRSCCPKNKTKCVTRGQYLDLYVGPDFDIGLRYSQILTTMFVVLIYSSGLPLLYAILFFYFLLIYWIDKWLILNFYKNPPHTDLYINKIFNIIILFGMFFHYCFAIWVYGNKNILTDNSNSMLSQISTWIQNLFKFTDNSYATQVLDRITYGHCIVCLIFLCLIFIFIVIRLFFIELFMMCCCKCETKHEKPKSVFLYDAIAVKKLYFNNQLRKAGYFKLKDNSGQNDVLINRYFRRMIDVDRTQIKRRLSLIAKVDDLSTDNRRFDEEIPPLMKVLDVNENDIIRNDVSYNIAYCHEFKDVFYYESVLPYLKNQK